MAGKSIDRPIIAGTVEVTGDKGSEEYKNPARVHQPAIILNFEQIFRSDLSANHTADPQPH